MGEEPGMAKPPSLDVSLPGALLFVLSVQCPRLPRPQWKGIMETFPVKKL